MLFHAARPPCVCVLQPERDKPPQIAPEMKGSEWKRQSEQQYVSRAFLSLAFLPSVRPSGSLLTRTDVSLLPASLWRATNLLLLPCLQEVGVWDIFHTLILLLASLWEEQVTSPPSYLRSHLSHCITSGSDCQVLLHAARSRTRVLQLHQHGRSHSPHPISPGASLPWP